MASIFASLSSPTTFPQPYRAMKTMKNLILSAVVLLAGLSGCSFSDDLRQDPTLATDVPISKQLPAIQVGLAYSHHSDIGRVCSYWTQQYNGDYNQQNAASNYFFNASDCDNMWNNYYTYMYSNEIMMQKAKVQGARHYVGVGQVLKAFSFGMLTSLWGDVPFSAALKANPNMENLRPTYDKQQDIYPALQVLLDSAIANLDATNSTVSPADEDFFGGGDLDHWKAAAHLLKARFYMHIRKRDPSATAKALTEITAANVSSDYAWGMNFLGAGITSQAPVYQFLTQRGDMGTCKTFTDTLVKYNDPRTTYLVDTTIGEVGGFARISGSEPGSAATGANVGVGSFLALPNARVNLISYEEAKFLEAEAALVSGSPSRAADAYNEAVKASVRRITGSADPAFETQMASETASSITLNKICTQKWIALPLDAEAYTTWRRTGLPNLAPVANSGNGGEIPRRWPYPINETTLNTSNVPAQGDRPMQLRVWWDN